MQPKLIKTHSMAKAQSWQPLNRDKSIQGSNSRKFEMCVAGTDSRAF